MSYEDLPVIRGHPTKRVLHPLGKDIRAGDILQHPLGRAFPVSLGRAVGQGLGHVLGDVSFLHAPRMKLLLGIEPVVLLRIGMHPRAKEMQPGQVDGCFPPLGIALRLVAHDVVGLRRRQELHHHHVGRDRPCPTAHGLALVRVEPSQFVRRDLGKDRRGGLAVQPFIRQRVGLPCLLAGPVRHVVIGIEQLGIDVGLIDRHTGERCRPAIVERVAERPLAVHRPARGDPLLPLREPQPGRAHPQRHRDAAGRCGLGMNSLVGPQNQFVLGGISHQEGVSRLLRQGPAEQVVLLAGECREMRQQRNRRPHRRLFLRQPKRAQRRLLIRRQVTGRLALRQHPSRAKCRFIIRRRLRRRRREDVITLRPGGRGKDRQQRETGKAMRQPGDMPA